MLGAGCPHRHPGDLCPEPVWPDMVGQQHGADVETNLTLISTASPALEGSRAAATGRELCFSAAGDCSKGGLGQQCPSHEVVV